MNKLLIEWKHFDVNDATCERCTKTGYNLKLAIEELRKKYGTKGIEVTEKEIKQAMDKPDVWSMDDTYYAE